MSVTRSSARPARHTAVHVAAGSVAKALLATIGITVRRAPPSTRRGSTRWSTRRARSATRSVGLVEVRARGVPPGLGSYATKEDRLDARLAAAVMGIQAVKGVEIGDGLLPLAWLPDRLRTTRSAPDRPAATTNHAGGIEAGVSNGEEIVVRAAMKPLPTLMKPLASVDLATGETGDVLRRAALTSRLSKRSRAAAEAALRRSSRPSQRTRRSAATRSSTSSGRATPPTSLASNQLERALTATSRWSGSWAPGKTTMGRGVAARAPRLARPASEVDRETEAMRYRKTIPEIFEAEGEAAFRRVEASVLGEALVRRQPAIVDLGAGAATFTDNHALLAGQAFTVLLDIDVDVPPGSVGSRESDRPPGAG